MRPSIAWPRVNCVVEDQSWETASTKVAGGAPTVELALDSISKPFSRSRERTSSRAMPTPPGPLWARGGDGGQGPEGGWWSQYLQVHSHAQVSQGGGEPQFRRHGDVHTD